MNPFTKGFQSELVKVAMDPATIGILGALGLSALPALVLGGAVGARAIGSIISSKISPELGTMGHFGMPALGSAAAAALTGSPVVAGGAGLAALMSGEAGHQMLGRVGKSIAQSKHPIAAALPGVGSVVRAAGMARGGNVGRLVGQGAGAIGAGLLARNLFSDKGKKK